jgi:hypothetical protein
MRADAAGEAPLMALVGDCEEVANHLHTAAPDDRLAASYPFLTMLSVAVSGWLMARQQQLLAASETDPAFVQMKQAAIRFYLDQVVPEATGLKAAALAPAALLYAVPADAFAS